MTRQQWSVRSAALGVLVLTCWPVGAQVGSSRIDTREPLSLEASIELATIVSLSPLGEVPALHSPDRTRFVVFESRPDVARNVNVERLLLFSAAEVELSLRKKARDSLAHAKPIAVIDVAEDRQSISDVQWLSANEIGYIARGSNDRRQAFVFQLDAGESRQVTLSATDVTAFSKVGTRLLYYAKTTRAKRPAAEPIGARSLDEVIFPELESDPPVALYDASSGPGGATRLGPPGVRLMEIFQQIWIAPDGKHAVTFAPATDAPTRWAEYLVPFYAQFGYTPGRVSSDPNSPDLLLRTRYQVIDLLTHSTRPLFDAPAGFLAQNYTPSEVFWMDDGKSAIVTNTFLPLVATDAAELIRRRNTTATVEIEMSTGALKTVLWEPNRLSDRAFSPITAVDWSAPDRTLSIRSKAQPELRLRRTSVGAWKTIRPGREAHPRRFQIAIAEDLNSRSKLVAVGGECGCSRVIYDPNPQAENYRFAHAEVVSWIDRNGISWHGGLLYPIGYASGKRYPLIVQTHGFDPDAFLVDGPNGITTAMAAQVFAAAGFVVLQIEDNSRASTLDEQESKRYAEGYRAGIASSVDRGIADPENVGLIAFSRTGLHAVRLLAEHPRLLAAVDISDSVWWGYGANLLALNYPEDLAAQIHNVSGGRPTPDNICSWFAQNPLYKLSAARAAIRLEANGPLSVIGYWEQYAVLKNAHHPVDFVYFPEGSHVLRKPAERVASQGGNLDWFRYWLKNEQDADLGKAAQYARWRRLRSGLGHDPEPVSSSSDAKPDTAARSQPSFN